MNFLKKRRIRKDAAEWLRHAGHLRHMREDLMSEEDLAGLARAAQDVRAALRDGSLDTIEERTHRLSECMARITPVRRVPALRENFEIIAVAVAVAMGFRTYFIQPFKIPTGSMQPTLYGITSQSSLDPSWIDRVPFRYVKWLITGQSYRRVHARCSGHLVATPKMVRGPAPHVLVAGVKHKIPRGADLRSSHSEYVRQGDLLWAGHTKAGDHIFVNKVAWNFRRPRRGDIMVFNTKGIASLPPGTHYIKRMVGLPNEKLSINPPYLVVNDEPMLEPPSIGRIGRMEKGYEGYQGIGNAPADFLTPMRRSGDSVTLSEGQYFALGDNTRNSRDGRYWGPVPQENLVGPALLVYWPFSSRWGLTD